MSLAWMNPLNGKLKVKTSYVFILVLFSVICLKNMFFSVHAVGIVDINRIKGHFIRNLAEHKLSDTKIRAATVLFNKSLVMSLKEYAENHGTVLVKKGAVLGFDRRPVDVTDDVMKSVANNMRRLAHA